MYKSTVTRGVLNETLQPPQNACNSSILGNPALLDPVLYIFKAPNRAKLRLQRQEKKYRAESENVPFHKQHPIPDSTITKAVGMVTQLQLQILLWILKAKS